MVKVDNSKDVEEKTKHYKFKIEKDTFLTED
jgi:hypothetical protein